MRTVLLLAANHLREMRWYAVIMAVWVVGLASIVQLDPHPKPDDVLFLVRQEAGYAIALALLMGASGIHNDRKTRRILSVLSKAVERRQYVGGLLLATAYLNAIFLVTVGICGTWVAQRVALPAGPLWMFLALPFCASVLAAAAGMLCGSFLHPLFATAAGGLLLAAQFVLERGLGPGMSWAPMDAIVRNLVTFDFQPMSPSVVSACVAALLEAAAFWLVAGMIFERRDIAVAVD